MHLPVHRPKPISKTDHYKTKDSGNVSNIDLPAPPSGSGLNVPPPPGGLPATGAVNELASAESTDSSNHQLSAAYKLNFDNSSSGVPARRAFEEGTAGKYSYTALSSAGVFIEKPMSGGTYARRDSVQYIILHSTETGSIADAEKVISSWSALGHGRHAGAQFVVDRDGTIYSTVNPDLAASHINVKKALAGYTNDNSIGIEIVRTGRQAYTQSQVSSVVRLVAYLQEHYGLPDNRVTTHHHVQPSDRSDPVGFDLAAFEQEKALFISNSRSSDLNSSPFLTQVPKPAPDLRLGHARN
jgi:hypothetical protein